MNRWQVVIDKLIKFICRAEEAILIDETLFSDNQQMIKAYIESHIFDEELVNIIMQLLEKISLNA